ncbi:MAG: UDP-N-acetylmuramoyl-tripeptide--D-alanyl-D-alanine ligase [Acidobacteriota bacterium]
MSSQRFRPLIYVTGSSGKTTTKEMIAAVLRTRWRVLKTPGNSNTIRATANMAKRVRMDHQAVVLEVGMAKPWHLRLHCRIMRPNISVITMVGTAHIGNFGGNARALAWSKSQLIRHMNPTGWAFINNDDPNTRHLAFGAFKGKIISIGIDKPATYRAYDIRYIDQGMVFKVNLKGKPFGFFIPIHGQHMVYNALFALAVGDLLGFLPENIKRGLSTYRRVGRRLAVYRTNGVRIIDDTCNANPNATRAALEVLINTGKGRNIAVLGNMEELGQFSAAGHQLVGTYLAKKPVHLLFTYGDKAQQIQASAIRAGFKENMTRHFSTKAALSQHLARILKPGDSVLIKGSHNLQMYRVVAYLKYVLGSCQKVLNKQTSNGKASRH